MQEHVLAVRGRDIAASNRLLYQNTAGEDVIRLELDSEWDGLTTVLFLQAGEQTVTPAANEDGTYQVPAKLLTETGNVKAWVEGSAEGKVLLHAVMGKPFIVLETDGTTVIDEPTQDIVSEAVRKANEAAKAANDAAETAKGYVINEAEAETLEPGEKATANLEKTEDGQKLKLGIPKGDKGDRGDSNYGICDIDEDGYLNAYYNDELPSLTFELEGNDLITSLDIPGKES